MSRLIRYIFVGGVSAFVDISVFIGLTLLIKADIFVSNAVSFHFALIANFFLGKAFVFFDKNQKLQRNYFLGVYLVSASGMMINTVILYLLIEIFFCEPSISKVISAIPVFAWNYLIRIFRIYNI